MKPRTVFGLGFGFLLGFIGAVWCTSRPASATGDEGVRSMHALESIAHSLERCPR